MWIERFRISLMGERTFCYNFQEISSRLRLKCDGTRAGTRFRLSAKRTSPFKSSGVSVQSTTGSRGVRISGSNAGYTMFRGSVKGTGYPLHSPVSPLTSPPVRHRVPSHFNWTLLSVMTDSMDQSYSWEANNFSAGHEVPKTSIDLKVHYRVHNSPPLVPESDKSHPRHRQSISFRFLTSSHLFLVLTSNLFPLRFFFIWSPE